MTSTFFSISYICQLAESSEFFATHSIRLGGEIIKMAEGRSVTEGVN